MAGTLPGAPALEHHAVPIFRVAKLVLAGECLGIGRLLHHVQHHRNENQGAAFQKIQQPLARVRVGARGGRGRTRVGPDGRDQHTQRAGVDARADGTHRSQLHLRDPQVDGRGRHRKQRRRDEKPGLPPPDASPE